MPVPMYTKSIIDEINALECPPKVTKKHFEKAKSIMIDAYEQIKYHKNCIDEAYGVIQKLRGELRGEGK